MVSAGSSGELSELSEPLRTARELQDKLPESDTPQTSSQLRASKSYVRK